MGWLDPFRASEVGDGAGDFENPVVGSSGKVELLHGLLQQVTERGVEVAVLLDLSLRHSRVGLNRCAVETGTLHRPGGFDPRADGHRGFTGTVVAQFSQR